MLKHEIKNILIQFLVDEDILEPSALSSVQRQIKMEKLRLEHTQKKRIRLELLERKQRRQKEKK